jgi:hypothetical protein
LEPKKAVTRRASIKEMLLLRVPFLAIVPTIVLVLVLDFLKADEVSVLLSRTTLSAH